MTGVSRSDHIPNAKWCQNASQTFVLKPPPRPPATAVMSKQKAVAKASQQDLNPRTTSYEFLGPPGATLVSLGVPFLIYALYFGCNESSGGCPPTPLASIPDRILLAIKDTDWLKTLWDQEAAVVYAGWYAFCLLSWAILPGDWVEGTTMRTGEKKSYKINGAPSVPLRHNQVSHEYTPS
jgi:Ergosterol biosynthesis ERG4/ERG24 family